MPRENHHPLDPTTFPLTGMRLIEASAGTGKTYTLANLFVRLILERTLRVDQVLVVTFTRAATEELRGRIRERLRQVISALQGPEDPLEEAFIRTLKGRCRAEDLARLRDALIRMDEAAIFTIHGFCQRMLTHYAFESGAKFDAEFANNDQEYRLHVIQDFWRQHLYPLSADEAVWVNERWQTPDDLLASLADALAYPTLRVIPAPEGNDAQIRAEFAIQQAEMRALWASEAAVILARLKEHRGLSRAKDKYAEANIDAAAAALARYLAQPAPGLRLPAGFELFTGAKMQASMKPAALKQGTEPPTHRFFQVCDALYRLAERARAAFLVRLQTTAIRDCRTEMAARKAAANVLSPEDLLTQLHAALQGVGRHRLAARIRETYPVALIDEFQDTDPLQYAIFKAVYAGHTGCGLFVIGDPKQAIYSFRGGDIFTYMVAYRATDPDAGRFTLETNWRSTRALVEAINALFESHPAPFVFADTIGYPRVKAADQADTNPLYIEDDPEAALQVWFIEQTQENTSKKTKNIPASWSDPHISEAYAAEIARLLDLAQRGQARIGEVPLQASDIAVLVRNRFEAAQIRETLHRQGIGSAFISHDSIFDTSEARELVWILEAVVGAGEERLVKRALAGEVMGWSAAELDALNQDDRRLEVVQLRFQAYATHWRRYGFMPMFNRWLHAESVPARLLAQVDGERRITNLRHLAELLQSASREVYGGMEGLLRWYRDQWASGRRESEDTQLRLESDENVVQVVTIHKSKGLQYPIVFLPFPWKSRPYDPKRMSCLFHAMEDDALTLDLGSEHLAAHGQLAERERLAEEMRLLYVALTRAQYRVYCTWGNFNMAQTSAFAYLLHGGDYPVDPAQPLPSAGIDLNNARLRERLAGLARTYPKAITLIELPREPAARSQPRPDQAASAGVRAFKRRLPDDWLISSYTGLMADRQDLPEQPDFDPLPRDAASREIEEASRPQGVFAFPKGARAGQCLHGILEELDFVQADAARLRPLVQRHLRRQALDLTWETLVVDWIGQILATPLDKTTELSLQRIDREHRVSEMGFYFPVTQLQAEALNELLADYHGERLPPLSFRDLRGMLNGFIDLVFEHDGRFFVVDYKSNHLGNRYADYSPDHLTTAMRDHRYDLQYLLYCVAVHRYLRQRIPQYTYATHFGGVYYLFLRGMHPQSEGTGIYPVRPTRHFIEVLDHLFTGRAQEVR